MKIKTQAFTLSGLVAVVAASAVLVILLLPMLARSRQLSQITVCANNLKQLALGINACADDRGQRFPPAILDDDAYGAALTWDGWINHYIGGNLSPSQLATGPVLISNAPKTMMCPADPSNRPGYDNGIPSGKYMHRSYAMVAVGSARGVPGTSTGEQSVDCNPPTYYPPLPPIDMGIGVWWTSSTGNLLMNPSQRDWNAPGYPTRLIQDAAGTILLVETACGDNYAYNAWGAACEGPTNTGNGGSDTGIDLLFQLPNYANPAATQGLSINGPIVYAAQGGKFNYAFHDGHVQLLKIEQTFGTTPNLVNGEATVNAFKGMWTIKAGD